MANSVKKNGKIKRVEKTVFFVVFSEKKTGKKKKTISHQIMHILFLYKSFTLKLGYYPTLGLDF